MTFTATYRDKTGAKREERVEAASRSEAVAALKARGIVPVRLGEHSSPISTRANHRSGNATRGSKGVKGLAVVLVGLILAGGGLWWWLGGRETPSLPVPDFPAKSNTIHEAQTKESKPATAKAAPISTAAVKASRTPSAGQLSVSANTPSTNNVTYIVPPLDPNDPDMALRSKTSQEIGSLLSITPGEPVPPFPYSFILEDDAKKQGETASNGNDIFLESLRKTKIKVKDTDSEAVAKHKEAIVTAQLDLLDGIKEGLSVNDTIRAAYELRVRAYEYRTELISSLREWAEGNPSREEFGKALAEINDKLKESGIMTIPAGEVIPELEEKDE